MSNWPDASGSVQVGGSGNRMVLGFKGGKTACLCEEEACLLQRYY
jgi:hypothetical protein